MRTAVTATILLIRHAVHSDYGLRLSGRAEVPLSAEGLRQAERLGERLADRGIASVQSSPRRRAKETATAIARHARVATEAHDALDEIDFGGWTDRSFGALEADPAWRAWNTVRSAVTPPGGEGQAAAAARAVRHVTEQAALSGGETIAMVTHCDIIRGVLCHYLGLPFDNLLRFDIDAASVSTLIVGAWGARVTGMNEQGGLR